MGASTQFTVYAGELCGILMALTMMDNVERDPREVIIFVDNQAIIRLVYKPLN